MKPRIYLVDDDIGIRTILSNIIEDNDLGVLIGEADDGEQALGDIAKLKPDIVYVDLLLPSMDGIEIISKIRKNDQDMQFIMISEVTSQDMISEAYKAGIEFYINKPINVVEVVSITQKAIENQRIRRTLSQINQTLSAAAGLTNTVKTEPQIKVNESPREIAGRLFSDIGIMSEAGASDLLNMVDMIMEEQALGKNRRISINMSKLYERLSTYYKQEGVKKSISTKAIEQRVRRSIHAGLQNIANLGIEDFGNLKFEKYSNSLYDFKDVKAEMDYVRGRSKYHGKVSAKGFLEGVMNIIQK